MFMATPKKPRRAEGAGGAPWEVIPMALPVEQMEAARCARCRTPLEVHQPEVQWPDRLLGTCPRCGAWHLISPPGGADPRLSAPGGADAPAS